jgi:hypothetical protein
MAFNFSPKIVTDGLVLYLDAANTRSYPGTGTTWSDLSRSGNNSTLVNGPTFNSANGGAIVFDGSNDYADITNPLNIQAQNITISTWTYPSSATYAITSLIDYDHSSTILQGWVLQSEDATTNRYYYFAYYDGSTFQPSTGIGAGKGIQLTTSIWQNLTYTKNGTSIIGYLNGIQVFTSTAGSSTISYQSNRTMRIGGVVSTLPGVGLRFYNGRVSPTQVYNRALSATEVLQNYNATKTRFGL